ncbi:MAG: hypothetical protein IRZ32_09460 [Solirubrobacteraceae bacterium]|nr:hypothetical protein [Solirubrobacteraceae bacterium]
MSPGTEVARFRPDDPDPVVQASFACSCCLRQPSVARIVDEREDGAVACRCDRCDRDWTVLLTEEQLLRIELRSPWRGAGTVVHRAA